MSILVSARKYDRTLLSIVMILLIIGTVMIFSSSTNISMDKYGNGTFYFRRHLIRLSIGLTAMVAATIIDYRILKKIATPFIIVTIILLVLTKAVYLVEGNHSPARWLYFGSFALQTSDLARFASIIYLATHIDRKRDRIKDFTYGFLPPIVITGLIMTLVVIQPDFSTAAVIGLITIVMLFMGGAKISHLIATASVFVTVMIPVLMAANYRIERIKAYFDASSNFLGTNYQVQQSLVSLGNGGVIGVGLGESLGKNLFLPAPHTDFILSIMGEEFGFIGIFLILTLFLAIFQRTIKISKECTDVFGIMLGMALSIQLILYAFINAAVVTGVVPTTGLPIPFVSFGGTNLMVNLICIGIILNISMAKRTVKHRKGARILFG